MIRRALPLVGLVLCACTTAATPSVAPSPTGSPVTSSLPATPTASASGGAAQGTKEHPSGLIAIGHSALTGEGTAGPLQAAPENSWATGTNPAVDSIYTRLASASPALAGAAANTARGGAVAVQLADQATAALASVPFPALAIIETIDNDIQCDGMDEARQSPFASAVRDAIQKIVDQSPNTKVLVVGQPGRPSVAYIMALVAAVPAQKAALTGSGICDFFTPDGAIAPAHFATLTGIIDAYEATEAKVCAAFPQCSTDGGVRRTWVDEVALYASDYAHLNLKGQAAVAAQMWPVVAKLFGLAA